eukprot:jgi/Chlat1/4029/Chrsp26S03991
MTMATGLRQERRSRVLIALLLAVLLTAGCFFAPARAEVDDEDEIITPGAAAAAAAAGSQVPPARPQPRYPLEYELPPAKEGIDTVAIFPNNPNKYAPAGSPVEMVVGVHNGGDESVLLHIIAAALKHPMDQRVMIQNFTVRNYSVEVGPGEQTSLSYNFAVDANLQPRVFPLQATLFYTGEDGTPYTSTFFNNTIEVIEPEGLFDTQTFFLYVMAAGVGALIASYLWGWAQKFRSLGGRKHRTKPATSQKTVETGTGSRSEDLDNEWLQGTSLDKKLQAAASAKKKKSK